MFQRQLNNEIGTIYEHLKNDGQPDQSFRCYQLLKVLESFVQIQ